MGGNKTTVASDGAVSIGQGSATVSASGAAVVTSLSLGGVGGIDGTGAITGSSLNTGSGSISGNNLSINSGVASISASGAIVGTSVNAGSGTIQTTGSLEAEVLNTNNVANVNSLNVNSGAAHVSTLGHVSGSAATFTGLLTTGTLAMDASSPTFTATYPGATVACTNLNLLSTTNKVLPTSVYLQSGNYFLALNSGGWRPNDDSSYYNVHIEDDTASNKIFGRARAATSSLEMVQLIQIPQNWRATAVHAEVRNSSGTQLTRNMNAYQVINYDNIGFTSLGSGTTLNEFSLTTTMDGSPYHALMIVVHTTSTGDYVGGGYVKLTSI